MNFLVAVGLTAAVGLMMSFLAWRVEGWREKAWFRLGGLVLFVIMLMLVGSSVARDFGGAEGGMGAGMGAAFMIVLPSVVAAMCWAVFLACAAMETITDLVRSLVGLKQLKLKAPVSLAESARSRRDYDEAERLYVEAIEQFPEEAGPCRALAEMLEEINRPTDAMRYFREAERREEDLSAKLIDRFAAAEIMADRLSNPAGATGMVEEFLEAHPQERLREYAEPRLQMWRARAEKNRADPAAG